MSIPVLILSEFVPINQRLVQVRQNSLEKLRRTAEKSLEKLRWYLKSR